MTKKKKKKLEKDFKIRFRAVFSFFSNNAGIPIVALKGNLALILHNFKPGLSRPSVKL